MLTYHEMRLVKATIPKLREQGERITTLMYGSMLKDHPELNNMFNTVNQVRIPFWPGESPSRKRRRDGQHEYSRLNIPGQPQATACVDVCDTRLCERHQLRHQ